VALYTSITRPLAAWEAQDLDFANWRRLSRLADSVPRWQRWWTGVRAKGCKSVASALAVLRALDEEGWAELEAARTTGGRGAPNPLVLAKRRVAAAGEQSGSREPPPLPLPRHLQQKQHEQELPPA
jgi:hypothetical protein